MAAAQARNRADVKKQQLHASNLSVFDLNDIQIDIQT